MYKNVFGLDIFLGLLNIEEVRTSGDKNKKKCFSLFGKDLLARKKDDRMRWAYPGCQRSTRSTKRASSTKRKKCDQHFARFVLLGLLARFMERVDLWHPGYSGLGSNTGRAQPSVASHSCWPSFQLFMTSY